MYGLRIAIGLFVKFLLNFDLETWINQSEISGGLYKIGQVVEPYLPSIAQITKLFRQRFKKIIVLVKPSF